MTYRQRIFATLASLLLTQPAAAHIDAGAGLCANPGPAPCEDRGATGTQSRTGSETPFGRAAETARGLAPIRLAHAILVKATPEKDAVLSDTPEELLLIFNEGVGQEFLALAVIDETGKRVDQHDAKLDFTDHSHLRASVSKLAPGKYTVRYRVLSADGHVVSGKYFFQVQAK